MLEKEFQYYLDHQNELFQKYNNRVLMIVGEEVVGDYESYDTAYLEAIKRYTVGTFLLQVCTEGDSGYTQRFHSRVRLDKLEKMLDEALEKETPESLTKWMNERKLIL
jgi:hypothetical protein